MSKFQLKNCFKMLMRKKMISIKGLEEHILVKRTLTVFDLCLYGIGSMCGGYIYGVSIVLVATKSGASSFISNIIAGVVAALNAQCYAELSSRLPCSGGGYNFTYILCGEFLALIIGWAMLLEYLLGFAFASVGAANAIDVLSNHTIERFISEYIGDFPFTNGYITDTPNVLAAIISICIVILLGFGAKVSISVNAMITVFSTIILIICAVFMAVYSNVGKFTHLRSGNLTYYNYERSNWFPFGISGIIGGAALTFNAFSGFDALCLTGDVVIDPRNSVPFSINICIILVFIITTFYYLCISFYVPWFMLNPKLGLSGMFHEQKIQSMQILGCIGEITGYFTSGFGNMFALSQIIFSISKDGLICPCFQYISPIFHVPIFTNLIFGLVAALMALLFDMNIIANFMSAGLLISYTIVAIDLLILRLINVEKKEMILPESKVGSTFSIKEIAFTPFVEQLCKSIDKISRPVCFIISIIVLIMASSLTINIATLPILTFSHQLLLFFIGVIFILLPCFILFLFKYYTPEDGFKVPVVPFMPILCIILNLLLASKLQFTVWCQLGVWLFVGFICYIFYGIWHSHVNVDDDESSLLIHNDATETLALSTD